MTRARRVRRQPGYRHYGCGDAPRDVRVGDRVRVSALDGLTLIVQPLDELLANDDR
jgi:hypothetical protein